MSGRETQSHEGEIEVKVTVGHSHDTGSDTTDFIVVDHSSDRGGHDHIVIDDEGNTLYHEYKENK